LETIPTTPATGAVITAAKTANSGSCNIPAAMPPTAQMYATLCGMCTKQVMNFKQSPEIPPPIVHPPLPNSLGVQNTLLGAFFACVINAEGDKMQPQMVVRCGGLGFPSFCALTSGVVQRDRENRSPPGWHFRFSFASCLIHPRRCKWLRVCVCGSESVFLCECRWRKCITAKCPNKYAKQGSNIPTPASLAESETHKLQIDLRTRELDLL